MSARNRKVDAFGTPIADPTTNVIDIASHYPYSPERWRVLVDGSRVFPEYDTVSQYNHLGPYHELMPEAGETVSFQTAERPRYVVSYELAVSFACGISRALEVGDSVRMGAWDGTDGWYIEHTGSQDATTATLVVEEANTRLAERPCTLARSLEIFTRFVLETSWYRVGAQAWRQTYSDGGSTKNEQIGRTSVEPSGGPEVGNLPVRLEVTRGAGNSALTFQAGSVGVKNLGSVMPFRRTKTVDVTLETGTAGDWVPLLAMRKDPARRIVNTQLTDLRILGWSGAGDVKVIMRAHDPSKVFDGTGSVIPDSDYFSPIEMSPRGSVLENAFTIAEAPDGTGTPVTAVTPAATGVAPTAAQRMGGYQVGYAALYATGGGANTTKLTSSIQQKRSLFGRDVGVVWVNADNAGEDLAIEITTEQDF